MYNKSYILHLLNTDMQVLPNCTLKEALNKTMMCMEPLFVGYPYSEQGMCRDNLNHAISCMSDVVSDCLGGSCPTVLDEIPNLRNIYRVRMDLNACGGFLRKLPLMYIWIGDINVKSLQEYIQGPNGLKN